MSNTLLTLRQRVRAALSDGRREAVTTALTTSTACASTNLNKWDGGRDDYFNTWFAYVEDYANAGASRQISDYATSGGACTVRSAWAVNDGSNKATVMFTKYDPDIYKVGIQSAVRKLYPNLYVSLNDLSLVTDNILPNSHVEDWTSSSYPDLYTLSSVTAAETTTAGLYRGQRGSSSAKITATGSAGSMYIISDNWPQLLDLAGHTVSLYAWAYPQVANDAYITIYTVKKDGTTTQTLTSTTTCAALQWTLLKLEDQVLNDDLGLVQIRFHVKTDTKYVYYDAARLTGLGVREYLLPKDFRSPGELKQVWLQTSSFDDDYLADDIHMRSQELIYNWDIHNDGTYEYLRLPYVFASPYKLRLVGQKPLESLSADSDTISVDDPDLELVIAKSCAEVLKLQRGLVSSDDRKAFDSRIAEWEYEVARLTPRFRKENIVTTARY